MLLAARIAIVIAALIVFTVIHIINSSYHLGAIPYVALLATGIYGFRWLWKIVERIEPVNKADSTSGYSKVDK